MLKANKTDLINYIKDNNEDVNGVQAAKMVNTVLEGMIGLMGDAATTEEPDAKGVLVRLALVGFGNFEVKHKPEKEHRNPYNGKAVMKPAHNAPSFKPGSAMKEIVNGQ